MDGGGFDPNDRIPSEQDARLPVRTDDALVPVTIKQILDANPEPGNPIIIDGVQRKIVSIVGIVRNVSEANIAMVYEIDDGTGSFLVQDFTHSDSTSPEDIFHENMYVYVCGRINSGSKDRSSQPNISAFRVKQVVDPNQIAFHYLQALYVHKYFQRGSLPPNSAFESNQAVGAAPGMGNVQNRIGTVGTPAGHHQNSSIPREELVKKAILDFLGTKDSSYGVHIDEIARALSNLYSVDEVTAAIEALAYSGEIYNASQPDHYAKC